MEEKSKESKGFVFIEMQKPGDATAARAVAGNKIRVKKAEVKNPG